MQPPLLLLGKAQGIQTVDTWHLGILLPRPALQSVVLDLGFERVIVVIKSGTHRHMCVHIPSFSVLAYFECSYWPPLGCHVVITTTLYRSAVIMSSFGFLVSVFWMVLEI